MGNSISKVKLAEDQGANGGVVRHFCGTGPIYIRSLCEINDDDDDDEVL